jgi:hypothetical protein
MGCRSLFLSPTCKKPASKSLLEMLQKVTQTQKISVSYNRNFLQKKSAYKNDLNDLFYVLEYSKTQWKRTKIECRKFRG